MSIPQNPQLSPIAGKYKNPTGSDIIQVERPGEGICYRLSQFQSTWYGGAADPTSAIPGILNGNLYLNTTSGSVWQYTSAGQIWTKISSGGGTSAGVNKQAGNYSAVSGDSGKLITFDISSNATLTLPSPPPSNTWFISVENTGSGVLTVSPNGLDIDGAAASVALLNNQGVFVFTDGTNYFTSRGITSATVPADGMQYVSGSGSDSNDGLFWNTAVKSIYQAWVNLAANAGSGTIYVASGAIWGGPVIGQGLMILGAEDPNYSSPPTGWLKDMGVQIIGVGTTGWMADAFTPAVEITGNDSTHPAIWISGTNTPITFENILTSYSSVDTLRLGFSSSGGGAPTGGPTSTLRFNNCQFQINQVSTAGPSVNVNAECFWLIFDSCVFNGNTAGVGDAAQAFVVNPNGGDSSGLIYIRNCNITGGGCIKYYTGNDAWSLFVDGLTTEAQSDGHGGVWLPNPSEYGSALCQNIVVSDATAASPAVESEGLWADSVLVVASQGASGMAVKGPARILNQYLGNLWASTASPLVNGQDGFYNGHVVGESPLSRRQFGPSVSRFGNNLASNDPSTYHIAGGSGGAYTGSQPGPDGNNSASAWTATASGNYQIYPKYLTSYTSASVGDFFIAGAWISSQASGGGFQEQNGDPTCAIQSLGVGGSGIAFQEWYRGQINVGEGEWGWQWRVLKITELPASTFTYLFPISIQLANPFSIAYPSLFYIPASAGLSDNEVLEFAATLQGGAPTNAVAGQLYTPQGQVPVIAATGFGNGSSGTAVTTTTKSTGSGPTTPQTIVGYVEVNISGTNYWMPYFS
jgi:hypothetical protein